MSNLLEQASLVMIPSGYKEDIVYSVIPTSGAGDLTFTRASNGTRIDSNGNVEVVPWNLILQSETFNDSYWNKVNGTITSNAIVAPNGTTTADLFTITNNSAFVEKTIAGTGTLFAFIPNTQYTFSCYFKKGSIDYNFRMLMYDGSALANSGIVNLTTPSSSTASYEDVGNGWYRFYHTFTSSASASNGYFYAVNYDYSTTITSGTNVYLWGAQVVQGSTAKPYFPTTDRLNVPRLTYQNGGGGCPSLLLEKQSTNLVTYSEQFDDASWSLGNSSITANATTSPDGTQNAEKLYTNTATSTHQIRKTISSVTAQNYTMSIFAKKGELNYIRFWEDGQTGKQAYFNLNTGVATNVDMTSASIENMGNGWYRCSAVVAIPASGVFGYRVLLSPDGTTTSFTGNGSDGVFLYGAQLEASSYATSYIPTTSSSATRVADACYKTGISSLIGQTEGTIFVDLVITGTTGNNRFSISDGSNVNWIFIGTPEDGATRASRFYIKTNNSVHVDVGSASYFTIGQRYQLALAYKSGDWAVYGNGTLLYSGTNSIASVSSPLSVFNFFNATSGSADCGEQINEAILFPTRLTNSELAQITGNQNYTINQAYASYGVASESPNCVQP